MRPGRTARHACVVQVQGTTQNVYGEQVEAWSQYAQNHYSIRPKSGREVFDVDQKYALATHVMEGRYRAGIRPDMRILFPRTFTTVGKATTSTTGTTIVVSDGSAFPQEDFRARIGPTTGLELVNVTQKSGGNSTSWTVTRGVDGTTAQTNTTGTDVFYMVAADIVGVMDMREGDRYHQILVTVHE